MKKILAVIRFLPQDSIALQFAASAAFEQEAELLLLLPYEHQSGERSAEAKGRLQAIATNALIKFTTLHMAEHYLNQLSITYHAAAAELDELVISFWKKEGVDLIVVSAYGHEFRFNPVAELPLVNITQLVNCPLLLISEHVLYTGWQRISFKAQLEFKDVLALSLLCQWAPKFGGNIYCFHFLSDLNRKEQAARRLEMMQSTISRLDLIDFEIQNGTFQSGPHDLLQFVEADILAMVTPAIHSWAGRANLKEIEEQLNTLSIPLLLMKNIDNLAHQEGQEVIVKWEG